MEDVSRNIDSIWIGEKHSDKYVLVLGESWYGNYIDNTDSGYVKNYLNGLEKDRMYTRMANACLPNIVQRDERIKTYWNSIAFTNFVGRVGDIRKNRPSEYEYKNSQKRLKDLLKKLNTRYVWILGIEQSKFSAPVIEDAGIHFEITAHPTSYGLSNEKLGNSWRTLMSKDQ